MKKTIKVSPMGVNNTIFPYKSFFFNIDIKNKRLQRCLPGYGIFKRQFLLFSPAYNPNSFAKMIHELVPSIQDIYKDAFSATSENNPLGKIAAIDIIMPPTKLLETLKTPNSSNRR